MSDDCTCTTCTRHNAGQVATPAPAGHDPWLEDLLQPEPPGRSWPERHPFLFGAAIGWVIGCFRTPVSAILLVVLPILFMAFVVAALFSVYPYVMWPLLVGVIVFLRYREPVTDWILDAFDQWNEMTAEELLQHLRIKSR